jgi:hypothetical protein
MSIHANGALVFVRLLSRGQLGWQSGQPPGADAAYALWNDAHTATLGDYALREEPVVLYHPSVPPESELRSTMSQLQIAILGIIQANDGKFSWYQIERALSLRPNGGGSGSGNLMCALRELEQAGFITTSAGYNPAQPLYSVTPTGQEQLEVQRA